MDCDVDGDVSHWLERIVMSMVMSHIGWRSLKKTIFARKEDNICSIKYIISNLHRNIKYFIKEINKCFFFFE